MALDDMAAYAPVEGNTEVQTESGVNEGQADNTESGVNEGQAGNDSVEQTGGEPTGVEGLPDGMTPDKLLDSYKNLQTELGKRTEVLKSQEEKFAKYGGIESLLNAAEYLTNNPKFQDFLKQEQNQSYLGEDADEDTVKALNTVRNVSSEEAQRIKNDLLNEYINPILQKNQEQHMGNLFNEMDNDPLFGDIWRDYQADMAEKVGLLPDKDNIDINGLKTVFLGTLQSKGELEKILAKAHNKKLASVKANSVETPISASNNAAPKQYNSLAEAFEASLRAQ